MIKLELNFQFRVIENTIFINYLYEINKIPDKIGQTNENFHCNI